MFALQLLNATVNWYCWCLMFDTAKCTCCKTCLKWTGRFQYEFISAWLLSWCWWWCWHETIRYACKLYVALSMFIVQRLTSLFGLVFCWVFSLSPKTNLTPEFWSQSEVWISWAKTGAKIATKIPILLIFVWLARYSFYLLFLRFTKQCAKTRTA